MDIIILASHGELARGMKTTLKMITGEDERIYAFGMNDGENPDMIYAQVEKVMTDEQEAEHFFLFSDFPGGSVNTELMKFLTREDVYLISGMNVPLLLDFVLGSSEEVASQLEQSIIVGKESLKEITFEKYEEEDIWEE